jgi:hypothetical protein
MKSRRHLRGEDTAGFGSRNPQSPGREKAGSPLDLEGLHALVQLVSGSSDEIEAIHAFVPAVARTIAKTSLSGAISDFVHDRSVAGYLYLFRYTPSTAAARDLWGPGITRSAYAAFDRARRWNSTRPTRPGRESALRNRGFQGSKSRPRRARPAMCPLLPA